ncbi:MAG TPA: hypothetical protein DDZ89_03820 [Clostridiales bacterium]|nr:hypothetical protein [Clostridiales bacterium]
MKLNKKNLLVLCLSVVLLTFGACAPTGIEPDVTTDVNETTKNTESIGTTKETTTNNTTSTAAVTEQGADEETIMNEFDALIGKADVTFQEISEFALEYIGELSADNASVMVLTMEDYMKEHLTEMEEVFNSQTVQETFFKDFSEKTDLNDPDDFDDEKIKELIVETKEKGYKVDHGEGMAYPVIDYSYLKAFNEYATPEIRDYIDIMAVESDQAFAKDAALIIGWDEVVNRALSLENYLDEYDLSDRTQDIGTLYNRYVYITLSGLDNTPLFDHETKVMKEEAKAAYEEAIKDNTESEYLTMLTEYMELLQKNEYKLSEEINTYRLDKTKA